MTVSSYIVLSFIITEPDSMSDQKGSEATSPDSSDAVTDTPQSQQSCVSSASESNVSCSSNSTCNETPLTSQNCSVLRKSFLNQVSDTASTSENVVSTTPKFQLKSSLFGKFYVLYIIILPTYLIRY